MPKLLLAALLAASFAASLAAQSPGFNCAKAATAQEKAICSSPELSKADAEMTAAYRSLLASVPPEVQPEIRQNQRAWLRERLSSCRPNPDLSPNADFRTDPEAHQFIQCLLAVEKPRADELRGMIQHRNGITFIWRSVYLTAPDDADTAKIMKERGAESSGYVNASWPQAVSAAPEWLAWNKAIAEAAGPVNAEGENNPRKQWSKADAVDQDTDVSVSLNSVSNSLITASIAIETYGHGAAHPNHGVTQFNWLLKEQRELKPEDVFKAQSGWKQSLYARTDKYLHGALDQNSGDNYQSFEQPGQMEKIVRGIAADPGHWQIDKKGITIVFNPYEVACYACTPGSFTMPWESLRPLLNPEFQAPRQREREK